MNPRPSLVELDRAIAELRAVAPAARHETVPIAEGLGRVLAESAVARANVPNLDVAAMDGYACRLSETTEASEESPVRLHLTASSRTGGPLPRPIEPGEACAVATGAAIPAGADAIVVVERSRRDGDDVVVFAPARRKHVRCAGEDLACGVEAIPAGVPLGPARIGLAASLGYAELAVVRRPRVAIVPTGPELAPLGATLAPGEVHDSNGALVAALLHSHGTRVDLIPAVEDDERALRDRLEQLPATPDLIVTTGGASVGRHDVVRRVVQDEGGIRFAGVSVRPGRPAMLGAWQGVPWLALPGTPHAVALLGSLLLGAWAYVATGRSGASPFEARDRAAIDGHLGGDADRTVLTLARRWNDADGRQRAAPVASGGKTGAASRLTTLSQADAVIVLPAGVDATDGTVVEVVPFPNG